MKFVDNFNKFWDTNSTHTQNGSNQYLKQRQSQLIIKAINREIDIL